MSVIAPATESWTPESAEGLHPFQGEESVQTPPLEHISANLLQPP